MSVCGEGLGEVVGGVGSEVVGGVGSGVVVGGGVGVGSGAVGGGGVGVVCGGGGVATGALAVIRDQPAATPLARRPRGATAPLPDEVAVPAGEGDAITERYEERLTGDPAAEPLAPGTGSIWHCAPAGQTSE